MFINYIYKVEEKEKYKVIEDKLLKNLIITGSGKIKPK
jgi:hypothetical protein